MRRSTVDCGVYTQMVKARLKVREPLPCSSASEPGNKLIFRALSQWLTAPQSGSGLPNAPKLATAFACRRKAMISREICAWKVKDAPTTCLEVQA
jgi:hypothetical protein